MEILFCDECGTRITGDAAQSAKSEAKKLCDSCRAKQHAAKPSNRQLQPAGRGRSERSIAAVSHGSHRSTGRIGSEIQRARCHQSGRSPLALALLCIGVIALLGVGAAFVFKEKPSIAAAPAQAPTATKSPSTAPSSPMSTASAPPALQHPAAPPAARESVLTAQPTRSRAQEADEAFAKLQNFDGLAADDREGRIQRVEAFLAKYSDEIVASRARVTLSELQTPIAKAPAAAQTASAPADSTPLPIAEGWKAVNGPFTFEDGQLNRWEGDYGSQADVGTFEGRACLRLRPGEKSTCRGWHGPAMDSAGVRVRFRYFAHGVEYVELLWAQGDHRPRKHIEPLVQDAWAEACFVGSEMGGNADRLRHIEIGGPAKSGESFLLLDDIVWEKQ